MKKASVLAVSVILSFLMLASPALASPTAEDTTVPRDWSKLTGQDGELRSDAVVAESAILMDSRTGKVLFEKDADARNFPASITKIMTCLVALSSGKDLTQSVTIGKLPAMEAGAETIDLKQGETVTLEQLLYGLMLMSGNDAANAIAIDVAGSVDGFISMMNDKAKEIGMTGTHYMNTNGLNDPDHYTTARDMALLTKAAQQYPEFEKIVSTVNYTMPSTNMHENARTWTNHNLLIVPKKGNDFYYQYATGVKTGYTSKAQSTLVSSAQKDDMKLIAVVLRDGKYPKWTDSITMFEYGFEYFDTADLIQLAGKGTVSADIKQAASDDPDQGKLTLALSPKTETAFLTDRKDQIDKLRGDPSLLRRTVTLTKDTAPIKQNEIIGAVTFTFDGTPVLVCDLKAVREVRAAGGISSPGGGSFSWLVWPLLVVVLLAAAAAVAYRLAKNRGKQAGRETLNRRGKSRR